MNYVTSYLYKYDEHPASSRSLVVDKLTYFYSDFIG